VHAWSSLYIERGSQAYLFSGVLMPIYMHVIALNGKKRGAIWKEDKEKTLHFIVAMHQTICKKKFIIPLSLSLSLCSISYALIGELNYILYT